MEEQENDLVVFDRLMKMMRKAIHLGRIRFINLGLRPVAFFIPGSLENGICDKAYILRGYGQVQPQSSRSEASRKVRHRRTECRRKKIHNQAGRSFMRNMTDVLLHSVFQTGPASEQGPTDVFCKRLNMLGFARHLSVTITQLCCSMEVV